MKSSRYNHIDVHQKPHIVIRKDADPELFFLIERACPAALYSHDENGFHYDYSGCLECGACFLIGGDAVFATWEYPAGGFGVHYTHG